MWLFTIYGFFSLSLKPNGSYQIRARARQHIVDLKKRFNGSMPGLKEAKITNSRPGDDYPYRVTVPQREVAKMVCELVKEQSWDNFKNQVQKHRGRTHEGEEYHHALHEVWWTMRKFEMLLEPSCKKQPKARSKGRLFPDFDTLFPDGDET